MRQFAPGLCGCGFDSRRCHLEENVVIGIEILILRRLGPSRDKSKHCKRSFIKERMLWHTTKVRKIMKKKKLDKKGKVKGKF